MKQRILKKYRIPDYPFDVWEMHDGTWHTGLNGDRDKIFSYRLGLKKTDHRPTVQIAIDDIENGKIKPFWTAEGISLKEHARCVIERLTE